MGNLTPGVGRIYERVDGVVYQREFGTNKRSVVGYDYDVGKKLEEAKEQRLWADIHEAAKTNPSLQKALEQCKIIYHLSKTEQQTIPHHPV